MLIDGLSLLLGLVAVFPLLAYAHTKSMHGLRWLFGLTLVLAALIYIAFAALWGDRLWLIIESAGVIGYALFYLASMGRSILWIALGWLLHPVWDIALHLFGPGSHIAPGWYAIACMSFDFSVAGYILYRHRESIQHA